ncbi:MAG: glycosyltransferase [Planctomycetota bacterium]
MRPLDLTVVICTVDRCPSLVATLASLRTQSTTSSWEVLVVDNGSCDGTRAAIHATARDFPVPLRFAEEPHRGLSHARNRALLEARGDAVLFLDDDVVCLPGLLAAHLEGLGRSGVIGTGGRIRPVLPAVVPEWFREHLPHEIGGPTARYDFGDDVLEVGAHTARPPPFGANMTVRRDQALEGGGFRTDLGWGERFVPGEESELYSRLARNGGRLLYLPQAIVEHHIPSHKVSRQYFVRWYRGHGRSTVIMRPPRTLFERLERIAGEARKSTVWQLRASLTRGRGPDGCYAFALRKAAKAQGKLLQLLGW